MATAAAQLTGMTQTELDQMFSRGSIDRVPEGDAQGTAIVAPGSPISGLLAKLIHILAWKGKVIDLGGKSLRNKVTPFGVKAIRAEIYKEPSWFDQRECIVLDYSKTSLVARWIRDEIRLIDDNFYLGRVYWGDKALIHFALQFPPQV